MEDVSRCWAPGEGGGEFEDLIRRLEDGVLIVEEGHVVGTNPALGRLVGLPAESLFGQRVSELLTTVEGRPVHDPSDGDAFRLRDSRGDLVPVSIRRVSERLCLVLDRARERRLEREVWRLSEELRRLGRELPHEVPAQEEVLGMIEHEIRTATTVIRGYTRMLMDERVGAVNPTQRRFLAETRRATERIAALLDNLLELASLERSEGPPVRLRPTRLHAIVAAAAEETRPLFADREQRLESALEAVPDTVSADPSRLQQVLVNLLSNAVKFAPRGSAVHLETRLEDGGRVVVEVRDDGPGVAAGEVEQVFAPFVQGSAARTAESGEGVGLGLAICRRIVEAHGGEIEAVPAAGGVFRLRLPLLGQRG